MKKFDYKNRNLITTKKIFKKFGEIIFKKIARSNDIEDVYKSLFFLYNKYSNKKLKKYNLKELTKSLIQLRKTDKLVFSKIYDDIQVCSTTYKLLHSEKILDIGRSLLGQKLNSPIAVSGTMLRLDPPNDRRNLYDWHQNKSGKNGLVLSVALNNINENNGALNVALKSHNLGYKKVRTKRQSNFSAQQYSIDQKLLKNLR